MRLQPAHLRPARREDHSASWPTARRQAASLFIDDGHPVGFLSLQLKPQSTLDVTATVQTGGGPARRPQLVWTPGVRTGATSVTAPVRLLLRRE